MSYPVVQWQIVTNNPDAAAAFYRDVFGWTITTQNALGYRQVDTGNGGLKGGLWPSAPDTPSLVQLFIGVPDIERAVADATRLGAKVIVPATTLPDGDVMAILLDPAGVTLGIVRDRSSDKG
jgi:predicted enzyme related to lactoylglutathione lyase